MQDHFEKIAMDKVLEVGGKKAFELLDESIERFNESLHYSETGGKEIRAEIAGYRKGLLELFRTQLLKGEKTETTPQTIQPNDQHESKQSDHLSELAEARNIFKKEVTEAVEQLADSYIESEYAISLIVSASETFANKVQHISMS
jgi:hypothetical protein